jgi:subtilisin family serine protease
MIKINTVVSVVSGLLACLSVLSNSVAYSDTGRLLSDAEMVVVQIDGNIPEELKNKVIRGTDFVAVNAREARELRSQMQGVKTYGVQNYRTTTNDPLEPQEYLTFINAASAWNTTTGSDELVVAVIDSGFALEHEDLRGRWFINDGEYGPTSNQGAAPNCTSRGLPLDKSCNNLDDDGNGFVDDWRGWDFARDDNDVAAGSENPDGNGARHGTNVAGMVGATGNNGVGIASINWGVKIMPIQVFDDDGVATTLELAEGLAYAIGMGVDVINLSLGSLSSDAVIDSLLNTAESAGVTVVAAAGNCGGANFVAQGCSFRGQMLYPATNKLTIAVAGTNLSDQRASFSSEGTMVDVAAPATGAIRTTEYVSSNSDGGYTSSISGTSFASPIVAGTTASIKELWPAANPRDVRAILVDSALKVSQMNGSIFTSQHGFGRIRPVQAFALAERCATVTLREDINCDGVVNLLDLSTLANQWNLNRSGRSDINQSGVTDLLDLSRLANRWGQ